MKIMLKVGRTVYFQVCRQIKAKTPFAPVFYDISKLKQVFVLKDNDCFPDYNCCVEKCCNISLQKVLEFQMGIRQFKGGCRLNFQNISRLEMIIENLT